MTALVKVSDGRAVADSREVAEQFAKRHDHVLRAIDKLIRTRPDLGPKFGAKMYPIATAKGATRHTRYMEMDRTGFMLLVMGFSGAKALALKVRWIDAFEQMEAQLSALAANDRVPVPTVDEADRYLSLMSMVREARLLGGKEAGIAIWRWGGAPDVFALTDATANAGIPPFDDVMAWFAERIERVTGGRARSSLLHADYLAWCERNGTAPATNKRFSQQLFGLGLRTIKSDGVWFVDIRLRPG